MQEQFNEKISLLIDDELEKSQALSLLRRIQEDETLKASLQRYQLVRLVLKNGNCCLPRSDFAEKVRRQILDEPVFFIPRNKTSIDWRTARKTGLALAASILIAVVWIADKNDRQTKLYREAEIAYAIPQHSRVGSGSSRLNDYLQAHDNSVYINNFAPVQPYTRVVGFQQE